MTKTMRRLFSRAAKWAALAATDRAATRLQQSRQAARRAAAVMLIALLTATTAWAETIVQNVAYVDADGNAQTASNATVVTSDMDGTSTAKFSSGYNWYYVNNDVTLDGAYNIDGDTQNIILGDGATLTVSGRFRFQYASLNIYCQSGGTGKLVVSGSYVSGAIFSVTSVGTLTINGGTVEVTNTASSPYGFSGNLVMNGGTATFTCSYISSAYAICGGKYYTAPLATHTLTANLADGNYWTTFYCGDADYQITTAGAYAYTVTVGSSEVTLTKRGADIPKGAAVIIVGGGNGSDASVSISLSKTSGLTAYGGTNDLEGVDVRTLKSSLGSGTFYVMGNQGDGFGFYQYTGEYMPACKAYLRIDGGEAVARSLTMVFADEASGITTPILSQAGEGSGCAWYTLDGRRFAQKPTTKGVYVNNGRKIVIK